MGLETARERQHHRIADHVRHRADRDVHRRDRRQRIVGNKSNRLIEIREQIDPGDRRPAAGHPEAGRGNRVGIHRFTEHRNDRRARTDYPAPLEIETTFTTWSRVDREVDMASESADPIERWIAKRRVALVVSILKGETSVAEAARTHGLTVAEVEDWREKFLLGAENALRTRPKDEDVLKDEQIKKLKQKIGDLVLDNDILREALKPYPLDRKTSDA